MDSTAILLRRIRDGDERAKEELARAYLPIVKRMAHGRLPASARSLSETDDIASRALQQALSHADTFEMRHEGAFLGFLRKIILHEVVNEVRRARARPSGDELDPEHEWQGPSPLENVMGREFIARYEAALERLTQAQRTAVFLFVELNYKYREIAEMMDLNSPDAARMLVQRGLAGLAKLLRDDGSNGHDPSGQDGA